MKNLTKLIVLVAGYIALRPNYSSATQDEAINRYNQGFYLLEEAKLGNVAFQYSDDYLATLVRNDGNLTALGELLPDHQRNAVRDHRANALSHLGQVESADAVRSHFNPAQYSHNRDILYYGIYLYNLALYVRADAVLNRILPTDGLTDAERNAADHYGNLAQNMADIILH